MRILGIKMVRSRGGDNSRPFIGNLNQLVKTLNFNNDD